MPMCLEGCCLLSAHTCLTRRRAVNHAMQQDAPLLQHRAAARQLALQCLRTHLLASIHLGLHVGAF